MKKSTTFLLICFVASLFMAGCGNVGDENPITPEKMQEISSSQDRGNFQPKGTDQQPGQ